MSDEDVVDAFPLIVWRCTECLKPLEVSAVDVVVCECGVVQRKFPCFIKRVVDFEGG